VASEALVGLLASHTQTKKEKVEEYAAAKPTAVAATSDLPPVLAGPGRWKTPTPPFFPSLTFANIVWFICFAINHITSVLVRISLLQDPFHCTGSLPKICNHLEHKHRESLRRSPIS
jgi:hypothetical protein